MISRENLLEISGGDTEFIAEILQETLKKYPTMLDDIEAALESEECENARFHAHTLKGMISNITLEAPYKYSLEVEQHCKEEDLAQAHKSFISLQESFSELEEEVKLWLTELS